MLASSSRDPRRGERSGSRSGGSVCDSKSHGRQPPPTLGHCGHHFCPVTEGRRAQIPRRSNRRAVNLSTEQWPGPSGPSWSVRPRPFQLHHPRGVRGRRPPCPALCSEADVAVPEPCRVGSPPPGTVLVASGGSFVNLDLGPTVVTLYPAPLSFSEMAPGSTVIPGDHRVGWVGTRLFGAQAPHPPIFSQGPLVEPHQLLPQTVPSLPFACETYRHRTGAQAALEGPAGCQPVPVPEGEVLWGR